MTEIIEIIRNPITISVLVMCVLCLLKLNVILSLLVASIVAGLIAGLGVSDIIGGIINGFGTNGTNALAYLLLGAFAAALADTGLADILTHHISRQIKGRKWVLLLILLICACLSGTVIPIHIAFIPILVPPMLAIMNKMKMDRRQAACVLECGLVAMYPTIPIGYGIIFQGIIADNMTKYGMPIELMQVWHYTLILGVAFAVGLAASWWFYRKPREYKDAEVTVFQAKKSEDTRLKKDHVVSLIAIAGTLFGQLYWDSMPLGAMIGMAVMIIGGAVKLRDTDSTVAKGIGIMGTIAFVMLVAGGYANVINETGAVDSLIEATLAILGDNRTVFVIVLILIGLLVTMGIGSSFGTVPVLAVIYVPLCMKMGISVGATCCLIACAACLGDAGSPASDSTLGPTAGLNADGQHDHIWDTCVPTFLFYNIPLAVFGFIGAMIL